MATKTEQKMVTIMLPKVKNQKEVFVSVNGVNWKIQRGVKVEVPDYVEEVLRHSQAMDELAMDRVDKLANGDA